MMDADQNTLRYAKVLIATFPGCFTAAPTKDALFTIEESPNGLLADMPQFSNLWD